MSKKLKFDYRISLTELFILQYNEIKSKWSSMHYNRPYNQHKQVPYHTHLISRGESEAHAHIQDCVSKPPNGSTDNIRFLGDMCPSASGKDTLPYYTLNDRFIHHRTSW